MKDFRLGCDGNGIVERAGAVSPRLPVSPSPRLMLSPSRRQFLMGAGLAAVGWAQARTALSDVALTPGKRQPGGDILVTVFLRGGADGLNIVAPYFEDAYHRQRPTLGVASPNDNRAPVTNRALDLDGKFGLHPALAPILPYYQNGQFAIVHACGSADQSRSHFEAMSTMERGLPDLQAGAASGWLARHLSSTQGENSSPLRAVAFSSVMPDLLKGATDASAVNSLEDFRLVVPGNFDKAERELHAALTEFYADGKDAVAHAGRETLEVLDTLKRIDPARYRPSNGAVYPEGHLGRGLQQVACLVRGDVGLEVACLDHQGPYSWDTHIVQNNLIGPQIGDLGASLAAFVRDMGPEMNRVCLMVFTEFGRRLQENGQLGTDHGRASVMFLFGGGVAGGKVYADWPGLEEKNLEPPGDLRVTTDYRDVLAEVVSQRLHNNRLNEVFPDYQPKYRGVVKS
jgi:uncharacterized protein (DUF1501 family)